MDMTLAERFEQKYVPEPNSGCWLWVSTHSRGRAMIWEPPMTTAARVSWQLHKGQIPMGLQVLHRCDTPMCVNPEHLFLGTRSDNMWDMSAKN